MELDNRKWEFVSKLPDQSPEITIKIRDLKYFKENLIANFKNVGIDEVSIEFNDNGELSYLPNLMYGNLKFDIDGMNKGFYIYDPKEEFWIEESEELSDILEDILSEFQIYYKYEMREILDVYFNNKKYR